MTSKKRKRLFEKRSKIKEVIAKKPRDEKILETDFDTLFSVTFSEFQIVDFSFKWL